MKSSFLSLASLLVLGAGAPSAAAATVVNGGFEDNAAGYTVWPGYNGQGGVNPAGPTGWTVTGGGGINPVSPAGAGQDPFNDGASTGAFAFLQNTSRLDQDVAGFMIGGAYTLSFDFNARNCCAAPGGATPTPLAEVYLNDVLVGSSASLFPAPGGVIPGSLGNGGAWWSASIPFTATAEMITLSFRTTPSSGVLTDDTTLILDNVAIVPEPGLLGLLACGLGGILARRRR